MLDIYAFLVVLGCSAYTHIPKDERKKLDVKAKRCALVGYGTEVNPLTRYSRDVNLMKNVEKEAEVNVEQCVELELTSEDFCDDFSELVDGDDGEDSSDSEPVRRSTRFAGQHVNGEDQIISLRVCLLLVLKNLVLIEK